MAHYFATGLARCDPRLNIRELYLFAPRPGVTAMIMTTNGDALISSSDTMHEETIYAFRSDVGGDDYEDVALKARFGPLAHADSAVHRHTQPFVVYKTGPGEMRCLDGSVLLTGASGQAAREGDVRAFVGVVPELWTADALGFRQTIATLIGEHRFDEKAFIGGRNYFARPHVIATVMEIANELISHSLLRAWTTVSLLGHAPEIQVARFGIPLFAFLLLAGRLDLFDAYHAGVPANDGRDFGDAVWSMALNLTTAASSAEGAVEDAARIADRFCPSLLPYDPNQPSTFRVSRVIGRSLLDNAHNTMWSLVARRRIDDGNTPDGGRWTPNFPYYGLPYGAEEQAGLPSMASENLCLAGPGELGLILYNGSLDVSPANSRQPHSPAAIPPF